MSNIDTNKIKNFAKGAAIKLIIIALPIILIIILLSAITWFVAIDEGTWKNDEKGRPSSYTNNTKIVAEKGIELDKQAIIKEGLISMGYSEEEIDAMTEADIILKLDLRTKLDRIIISLDECTAAEILWCISDEYSKYLDKPEQLEFLLNAEIVTQYPKLPTVDEGKLNGIVEFNRKMVYPGTDTESETILRYIDPNSFNSYFDNYEITGDQSILGYYTLDEEGNVVVATWSTETGSFTSNDTNTYRSDNTSIQDEFGSDYIVTEEYSNIDAGYTKHSLQKTQINYKSIVQRYSLPFEYLWSLLVIGDSYEFVEGLAQLAYDSEIRIGIYDCIRTTETINRKDYTLNLRERSVTYDSTDGADVIIASTDWSTPETHEYYAQSTITITYDSVQVDIEHANTWLVEETSKYKVETRPSNPDVKEEPQPDESWRPLGNGYQVEQTQEGRIITYRQERMTGQKKTTTINYTYSLYEKDGKTELREKTDTDEDTDMNFVKLLKADRNAYLLITNKGSVKWLVEILENNESTTNMVDMTLYLLNKATGTTDYIDGDVDFESIFEKMFIKFSNSGASDLSILIEIVDYFEGSTPIETINGVDYYIAEGDSQAGGLPTIGHGVTTHIMDYFPDEYKGWGVGSKIPVSVVDAVREQDLKTHLDTIKSRFPDATPYQAIAMASVSYNLGPYTSLLDRMEGKTNDGNNYYTYNDYNADKQDKFGEQLDTSKVQNYIKQLESGGNMSAIRQELVEEINCKLYTETWSIYVSGDKGPLPGLVKRRYLEWLMFQYGYIFTSGTYYSSNGSSGTVNPDGLIKPCGEGIAITCHYGEYSGHGGTDFGCPRGSDVYAAHDGEVVEVVNRFKTEGFISDTAWNGNGGLDSYGNYVRIKSSSGKFSTLYAHNTEILVSVGDKVSQGQVIAKSGHTGNSSGPHLHFELNLNGSRVNSEPYINTNKLRIEGYLD